MTPYSMYLSTDQFPVLRNLFEVDSKNFNLMTWRFTKDEMICTVMNDIESIITCNILTNFDEYIVPNGPVEITIEPKDFFKQILREKKKKDIIELMIRIDTPNILDVNITDSSIGNVEMGYQFYSSFTKPKAASFPKFDCNLSFIINSNLFHSTLKGLKPIKDTFELVVKDGCIRIICFDDFKVNANIKIGESEKSLLFSEEDMQDISCSFGKFRIDTINQFQKLTNFSHTIEVRLMRRDKAYPIVLIYDVGSLGKKHLIVKPIE